MAGVKPRTPEAVAAEIKATTKVAFLAALAETCSVTKAVRAARISRSEIYNWRDEDPAFASSWEVAKQRGVCALEDEAVRRGAEGYEEPVFYEGAQVATVRKYSDNLLKALLAAHNPAFRATSVDVTSAGKSVAPPDPGTLALELSKLLGVLRQRKAEDEV